jgi:hypothetical protein
MKVFFSYASEDGSLVDQVYRRVVQQYPEIEGWIDKYQIVGGNELIEKIAAGIDDAEKFLIFLSARSIDKPWVRAELRKALMKEFSGVNPEFIIPVKLGPIPKIPPFLESKRYIDLENKTQDEWLKEIHAAITGVPLSPGEDTENNLQVRLIRKPNTQHTAFAVFEARYWAEDIGFELKTNSPIRSQGWGFPAFSGMRQISILEKKEDYLYAVQITNERIVPRSPFVMWVTFDKGVDPRKAITKVNRWDGTGGEPSLRFIDFTSQR